MCSSTFFWRFCASGVFAVAAPLAGGTLGVRMETPRKVALLIETSNTYAREVLHGIRAWQREHGGWTIRLSEQGRGAEVPGWLEDWRGDGVIARVENERIATALRRKRIPVVDVSAALAEPPFPRVVTDSSEATRLAAEHLCERGFEHFGYCGDPRFLWARQRGRYFQAHLAGVGKSCATFAPPARSMRRPGGDGELRAIARWLERLPRPAGVLACYDIRGQQVLEACQLAGLRVPDEIAVIGVHNDELVCDLCAPPLTSVMPDARRAGCEAAALLTRMMAGERVAAGIRTVPPVGVACRQSTDVVAVSDEKVAAAVRFMREHAHEGIGVADVLRAVPMSRTLLERRFKVLLGRTLHEHLLRTKLDRVRMLLATTDLSVGAIAEKAGFAYQEYLTVAFRRATGLTPRAFRQRHRTTGAA
ncbi:MAG: substrate-binding domain-containing protein [Opitutaceae bacterium]